MRRCSRSASERAAWIVAIRNSPCFRIGTSKLTFFQGVRGCKDLCGYFYGHDLVPEQSLSLLNTTLQIADGIHLSEIDADGDKGLGNFWRKTGDNDGGTEEA